LPAPNVGVPYAEFVSRSTRHISIVSGMGTLPPALQRLVAELVMMRMFDELMESISGVAKRLACGAPYVDGTAPRLLVPPAHSTAQALDLFETLNRGPRRQYAKWSRASYINDTTQHVLDPTDSFTTSCSRHGGIIREMQGVRNRIAHGNGNARTAFARVVTRRYGANLNHITPGVLLISPRFQPPLLSQYLAAARVIARDAARA
jgi:hypothetical protein